MGASEQTFGMIKPEAFERGLVPDIEKRIYDACLTIEERKRIVMSEELFEQLYGHTRHTRPKIYGPMKEYMLNNAVEVLKITGMEAVRVLSELRGASNPADALLGTIRGDYAKDQDYTKLYEEGRPSLNVFHASDSLEEAERMLKIFFGEKE